MTSPSSWRPCDLRYPVAVPLRVNRMDSSVRDGTCLNSEVGFVPAAMTLVNCLRITSTLDNGQRESDRRVSRVVITVAAFHRQLQRCLAHGQINFSLLRLQ